MLFRSGRDLVGTGFLLRARLLTLGMWKRTPRRRGRAAGAGLSDSWISSVSVKPRNSVPGKGSPASNGTSTTSAGGATDTGDDCTGSGRGGSHSDDRLRSRTQTADLAAGEWLPRSSGGCDYGGRNLGEYTPCGRPRIARNVTAGRSYHKCPHGPYINEFDYACQLHFNRTLS